MASRTRARHKQQTRTVKAQDNVQWISRACRESGSLELDLPMAVREAGDNGGALCEPARRARGARACKRGPNEPVTATLSQSGFNGFSLRLAVGCCRVNSDDADVKRAQQATLCHFQAPQSTPEAFQAELAFREGAAPGGDRRGGATLNIEVEPE